MRFSSSRSKRMQTSRESGDRLGELSAVSPQEWVRAVEGASARPKTIVSSTITLSMKLRGVGGKGLCDCRMTEAIVPEDHPCGVRRRRGPAGGRICPWGDQIPLKLKSRKCPIRAARAPTCTGILRPSVGRSVLDREFDPAPQPLPGRGFQPADFGLKCVPDPSSSLAGPFSGPAFFPVPIAGLASVRGSHGGQAQSSVMMGA